MVKCFCRSLCQHWDSGHLHHNQDIPHAADHPGSTWNLLAPWINCTLIKHVFLLFCSRDQGEVLCRNTATFWEVIRNMKSVSASKSIVVLVFLSEGSVKYIFRAMIISQDFKVISVMTNSFSPKEQAKYIQAGAGS